MFEGLWEQLAAEQSVDIKTARDPVQKTGIPELKSGMPVDVFCFVFGVNDCLVFV